MQTKRGKIVKSILVNSSALGSGVIVGFAVAAVVPPGLKLIPKLLVGAGSAGLGLVVGEAVAKGVDDYIESVVEAFSGVKVHVVKEDPSTAPTNAQS